jgi:hypothetical protein
MDTAKWRMFRPAYNARMYSALLTVHSWLRWVVLLIGLLAAARGISGWRTGRPWTLQDERIGRFFATSLDLQMLLGLALYFFLSPFTRMALQDFGAAMRTSSLRFWAVEHLFGMLVALVIAHVGRARIRKAPLDERRHKAAAIAFTLALLVIIASIPWPGLPNGRALFRW